MNTKLKRFFTDYSKDPNKDIFKMWENWEDSHTLIEEECGQFPGKDIAHVPMDEVIWYACRDSDATLRLNPILEYMKSRVRQFPQEAWRN